MQHTNPHEPDSPSPDARDEWIEQQCDRFEAAWQSGTAPRVEDFLDDAPEDKHPQLLFALLLIDMEFLKRTTGKRKLDDYLARFPKDETTVHDAFEEVEGYQKIDNYRLIRRLGFGGMGTVYLAEQEYTEQMVAIKIMRQILLCDQEAKARFRNEMRSLGKVEHPNVVSIKYANLQNETPFLVMEYVDGITLEKYRKDYLASHGSIFSREYIQNICRFILQTAEGLQCIHENGLIHRDIKPLNLMLTSDGQTVKILDLGLAKLQKNSASEHSTLLNLTRPHSTFGTLAFMSPEQCNCSRDVDIRSDIYSLGRTFLHLLSEDVAFDFHYVKRKDLPKRIREIIEKTLQNKAEDRYQTPAELVTDLKKYLHKTKNYFLRPVVLLMLFALSLVCLSIIILRPPFHNSPVQEETASRQNDLPLVPQTQAGTMQQEIRDTVQLRYQGDGESSVERLFQLEERLQNEPRNQETDSLIGTIKVARADAAFFTTMATGTLSEKTLKQMFETYAKAVELQGTADPFFESTVLLKQAMVMTLLPDGDSKIDEMLDRSRFLQEKIEEDAKKEYVLLLTRLADAVIRIRENSQPIRRFIEYFELDDSLTLRSREKMELRLFAIEFLINHDREFQPNAVKTDLESLDKVLFQAFDSIETARYLNRYFDLAIRCTERTNNAKLTQYIRRMRPGTEQDNDRNLSDPGSQTQLLFYFSPNENTGLVVYYPSESDNATTFVIPYSRSQIREIASSGETVPLDEDILTRVWSDRRAGIPIVLSWNDVICWPRRRDGFTYDDWPFDESITVEEIFGLMK